jgi:hypothetical protein
MLVVLISTISDLIILVEGVCTLNLPTGNLLNCACKVNIQETIYISGSSPIFYIVLSLICIDASYIFNAINSGFQLGMILHPVAEFM